MNMTKASASMNKTFFLLVMIFASCNFAEASVSLSKLTQSNDYKEGFVGQVYDVKNNNR